MIRFAAVFGERPQARDQLARAVPGTLVAVPGFAAAWPEGSAVYSVREGTVTCVIAGRSGDAAALARAFAQGRVELDSLVGGFTVLLWDEGRRHGLVATDRLGLLAPVYRRDGEELALALEARDLLALLPRRPPPDDQSVAGWLGRGSIEPGATLYSGVERLPGGHVLEPGPGGWSRRRDRGFEYRGTMDASRGEIEREVRTAVEGAVAGQLDADRHPGVLLSGGLDSTVVAAAAVGSGRRLRAYSLTFPEHSEVDESSLISATAAELGLDARLVPFRGGQLLPAAADFIREWELPPASPTLAIQLPLLRTAADEGSMTLLDGQGGDELFGASPYLLADRLRQGRLPAAWTLAHRIPGVPEDARSAVARRALRKFGLEGAFPYRAHGLAARIRAREAWAPPWLTPAAANAYRETTAGWAWKRADGPRWWAALVDSVTEQRERVGAHEYLRRRNTIAGVEGRHPLLQDESLIELALRLPPELAFDPRFDRPLLRSAMASVPEPVRHRGEKAFFTPLLLEAVERHDAPELRQLLTAKDAAIGAYTRPEGIRELLDVPPERRGEERAFALWRLAVVELWLRHTLR